MAADGVMCDAIAAADLVVGFGFDPVEVDKLWHAERPIHWVLESPNANGIVPAGVELVEVAPGLSVEENVLSQMAFRPVVSPAVQTMRPELFRSELLPATLFRHFAGRRNSVPCGSGSREGH